VYISGSSGAVLTKISQNTDDAGLGENNVITYGTGIV
jgi:hypothetical protein